MINYCRRDQLQQWQIETPVSSKNSSYCTLVVLVNVKYLISEPLNLYPCDERYNPTYIPRSHRCDVILMTSSGDDYVMFLRRNYEMYD